MQLVHYVFFGLITILFGWLFIRGNRLEDEMRRVMKEQQDEIKEIEKEQQEIKFNYLSKFVAASEERHLLKEVLLSQIGALGTNLLEAISALRTDISLTNQIVQQLKKERDRRSYRGD